MAGLYFAKQSYYHDEPEERGEFWKVVTMPGRGKGMIATKDIPVCYGQPRSRAFVLTTDSKVP